MDLFEQNNSMDEWMSFLDDSQSIDVNESIEKLSTRPTTTIERSLDVSPIRKKSTDNDCSYASVFDFDEDLSFDKSKSSRKYFSCKKALQFSPMSGSTPKPSKTIRRTQTKRKKKSYKNKTSDISLWDKAIVKSPGLKQWINSFNEEMKKIESSELSVTKLMDTSNN